MAITFNHILGRFKGPTEKAILARLKDKKNFQLLRKKNLELTKKKLRESVNDDILIINSINAIIETNKTINILSKKLREWYELYNPELSKSVASHEKFAELVQKKKREKDSLGSILKDDDLRPILELSKTITDISKLRSQHESYLEKKLKKLCPNLTALAGASISAKLIEHTGSLKRLALFPASTIQLLGAEKALFRHLKTKSKCPKHGLIIQHQLVQKASKKNRGKVARMLADKLSIAAKVDYFKGEFIGSKLLKELEEKVKNLK